jgi:phosphoribosylanthranilate isomerase
LAVRTRIKICGIRSPEIARAGVDAGADALGFVFVRSSPRSIEPEEAWAMIGGLPPLVSTVGVFVNAPIDAFCDIEERCPTTYSQLQGNEEIPLVRQCGPGVIKAIRYDAATIRDDLARWDGIDEVDAILVDGSAGGLGESFDWSGLATHLTGVSKPVVLAGGLTPGNVAEAIRAVRPFAVDVSSGVEMERGVKDPALIEAFCEAVREADRG